MKPRSRFACRCLALLVCGGCVVSSSATGETGPRPAIEMRVPATMRLLPPGGAIGALIGFDPNTHYAEFRITCGWDSRTHRKIAPGFWRLRLRGLAYESERDPMGVPDTSNLVTGHVVSVSRATWEKEVLESGFSGFIVLRGKPFLTNGPGTDVCHGVF